MSLYSVYRTSSPPAQWILDGKLDRVYSYLLALRHFNLYYIYRTIDFKTTYFPFRIWIVSMKQIRRRLYCTGLFRDLADSG